MTTDTTKGKPASPLPLAIHWQFDPLSPSGGRQAWLDGGTATSVEANEWEAFAKVAEALGFDLDELPVGDVSHSANLERSTGPTTDEHGKPLQAGKPHEDH